MIPTWYRKFRAISDFVIRMIGSTDGVTVANLPAASTSNIGARATVTDASVTTFNTVIAAGGTSVVPVFCDGTDWRIG